MKDTEVQLNVRIESELHRQVKIRAAENRKTVAEIVEAALRLYLDGGPTKEGK